MKPLLPKDVDRDIAKLTRCVCEYAGITYDRLWTARGNERGQWPRAIFCYIARYHLEITLSEIAATLRLKHHGSVIYLVKVAKRFMESDANAKRHISEVLVLFNKA